MEGGMGGLDLNFVTGVAKNSVPRSRFQFPLPRTADDRNTTVSCNRCPKTFSGNTFLTQASTTYPTH